MRTDPNWELRHTTEKLADDRGIASTYLHIPILLVLLGIVARGSAFTFRHYDPQPGPLEPWYTWIFRLGSALTPLFLGVIAGAVVQGRPSLAYLLRVYKGQPARVTP